MLIKKQNLCSMKFLSKHISCCKLVFLVILCYSVDFCGCYNKHDDDKHEQTTWHDSYLQKCCFKSEWGYLCWRVSRWEWETGSASSWWINLQITGNILYSEPVFKKRKLLDTLEYQGYYFTFKAAKLMNFLALNSCNTQFNNTSTPRLFHLQ